jgi:hypothetical protein
LHGGFDASLEQDAPAAPAHLERALNIGSLEGRMSFLQIQKLIFSILGRMRGLERKQRPLYSLID